MSFNPYLGGLESRGWMGPASSDPLPVVCSCGEEHDAGDVCPSCGEEPVSGPEGDEDRAWWRR